MKRHVAKEEGRSIRVFCNTEEYGMLQFYWEKMFKRRFLGNTLFEIPHFAQVYLRNRNGYRSTVKCIVKRKKRVFRSYAKLKIEICPQVIPPSQILSHIVLYNCVHTFSLHIRTCTITPPFTWHFNLDLNPDWNSDNH